MKTGLDPLLRKLIKQVSGKRLNAPLAYRTLHEIGAALDRTQGIKTLSAADRVPRWTIKTVQPSSTTTPAIRQQELKRTDYNVFRVRAGTIDMDLLSDSGTGALSDRMWAAIMEADERYAHSVTYEKFVRVAR